MLGLGIEAVEDISLQLGSGGVSKAHAELAGEGRELPACYVPGSRLVSRKRRMGLEEEHRQCMGGFSPG